MYYILIVQTKIQMDNSKTTADNTLGNTYSKNALHKHCTCYMLTVKGGIKYSHCSQVNQMKYKQLQ